MSCMWTSSVLKLSKLYNRMKKKERKMQKKFAFLWVLSIQHDKNTTQAKEANEKQEA